jgi:hypothetical protein
MLQFGFGRIVTAIGRRHIARCVGISTLLRCVPPRLLSVLEKSCVHGKASDGLSCR